MHRRTRCYPAADNRSGDPSRRSDEKSSPYHSQSPCWQSQRAFIAMQFRFYQSRLLFAWCNRCWRCLILDKYHENTPNCPR